jgi:hypothetical protein
MRSRLHLALTRLLLAILLAATPSVALAQADPHHPDDGTTAASPGEEQPAPSTATETETAGPSGTPAPGQVAACPGAMPMMGMMMGSPEDNSLMAMPMMQMMQGMAGMQMQMMQGMQMMQQTQLEMMRTMQSMQQQMMTMQRMLGDQRPMQESMP